MFLSYWAIYDREEDGPPRHATASGPRPTVPVTSTRRPQAFLTAAAATAGQACADLARLCIGEDRSSPRRRAGALA